MGEESQAGLESRSGFSQADFDEWHFGPRLLQHAEAGWRGLQRRADREGGRFPPCSQFAALADRRGLCGKEMPPGLMGIQPPLTSPSRCMVRLLLTNIAARVRYS
jgi:hypothetical protein